MEKLKVIFSNYARNEKNVKGFILSITKVVLENLQITGYFEGFGKVNTTSDEVLYDSIKRKILLNPELIIDNALNCIKNFGIDTKKAYPFIYAYLTDILMFRFKNMMACYEFDKGIKSLETNIFACLNPSVIDLPVSPFVKEDYLDFSDDTYDLHPLNRSYFYFSLSNTLRMLEGLGYDEIITFFKNDFYGILLATYESCAAPIELLMQVYEYQLFSSDTRKNENLKKQFLDFSKLEFYDKDYRKMHANMMKYSLEDRFKYGMPLTSTELNGIARKLG